MTPDSKDSARSLRVVSLFSGIGGGDLGLERAGHSVVEMCESWAPARRVLAHRFPGVHVADDVRTYTPQIEYDLLSAGFPCVDLSHAGTQTGIFGPQSGLVEHVFRIAAQTAPAWILIENVPNLLRLQQGAGIRYIIENLERLHYRWAYRVLDSRAFGVAQRRNRVVILAALAEDPARVLLSQDVPDLFPSSSDVAANPKASGFYWTEGRRGVGLVSGATPTLKGGSTLGLPSAPAVWLPAEKVGRRIVLPTIEDAEELQGLDRGWTSAADKDETTSARWKLVGNAITVGVAEWIGARLSERAVDGEPVAPSSQRRSTWPDAAFGESGTILPSGASRWPICSAKKDLNDVIDHGAAAPLSYRATLGFLSRIEESGIELPTRLMSDLESHLAAMRQHVSGGASWASNKSVRARMQRTRQQNTTPEIRLRRALSDLGIRYRLQVRPFSDLRWRSDIVFIGLKLVVEVRGCYWHVCPIHQSWPKANAERWAEKLRRNQERDRRMEADFNERGWEVIVVWEHEESVEAAARIQDRLRQLKSATTSA
ncbi:MAG: DNA mismatch endonuclease Vsr [Pseudolysinimonas sp.]|uniref:DNA mismatch endonuclease Vsr n=1 Tax=Pseudolysinimonas sp. TaxID=2680009 RepID=UPI003C775F88